MSLFFYGTLLDPDLRRIILGQQAERLRLRPALLPGFRRYCARQGDYPVLQRRTGHWVRGALVEGLDSIGHLAVGNFEGEDYAPWQLPIIGPDGQRRLAWVYLAQRPGPTRSVAWTLRRWQLRAKPALLPRLQTWSRSFGAETLEGADIPWQLRRQIRAIAAQSTTGYDT